MKLWKIQLLMNDVKHLLTHFRKVNSHHVYREINRATDYVAYICYQILTHKDIDPYIDNDFFFI